MLLGSAGLGNGDRLERSGTRSQLLDHARHREAEFHAARAPLLVALEVESPGRGDTCADSVPDVRILAVEQ